MMALSSRRWATRAELREKRSSAATSGAASTVAQKDRHSRSFWIARSMTEPSPTV